MKTVYVVWNDFYHPSETYRPITEALFSGEDFALHVTESIREVLELGETPDLTVNFTVGRPEGEAPLSLGEQRTLKAAVERGMGMLYVHGGMAVIDEGTPVYEVAGGRFLTHPPEHVRVACFPLNGVGHPVLAGVKPFSGPDEHYFCKVDAPNVQPLLCTVSEHGTELGGWARELGEGRVVSLTQGHTREMLAAMEPLLRNAVRWICRMED